ncbi:MAG: XdhC family protein [Candidatus Manganitrophus sp.]|nr:MAG: XdhC family protein [Candidatus Manganitrophus sp.]
MIESLELFEKASAAGGRAVMATLINTKGPTPRKAGARMFVGEGGRIFGSVTIGGCVDARVIEEAEAILTRRVSKRIEMALGDEEAGELGLTCGGNVDVLIDFIDFSDPGDPVVRLHELARQEMQAGRRSALVTLVTPSCGPNSSRTRMLIGGDGRTHGTLGNPLETLRERLFDDARTLMSSGSSRMKSYRVEGETVEVFIEVFGPPFPLFIFGGSHVAIPLVSMAKIVGLRTILVDGRPRFANRERFPEADEVIVGIPSEVAERLPLDAATSLVLLTHDYKYEVPVLKRALATDCGYIGLLGSRRRGRAILDLLREQGTEEVQLQRVRVPVGLNIGAQTAPEIALSILSEILAVRNARFGGSLSEADRFPEGIVKSSSIC